MAVDGEAVQWSEGDLDSMAEINLSDVHDAVLGWREGAPPRDAYLLDAEAE